MTNPRAFLCVLAAATTLLSDASADDIVVELRDMAGSRGLVGFGQGGFTGPPFDAIEGFLGASSALVDANGDGFDDLLVGAPGVPFSPSSGIEDDTGRAYLIFGGAGKGLPGTDAVIDVATASSTGLGVEFRGRPGDRAGASVAAAGDVNNDGFDDFIIGTPGRTVSRSASGGAYIVFGSATLSSESLVNLEAFATTTGAVYIEGAVAFGAAGTSVSGDVDVNADTVSDVVVGAPFESSDTILQAGAAYVVYGGAGLQSQSTIDLATVTSGDVTIVRGSEPFQLMGQSVAGLGQFDPVLPMSANVTASTGDDVAIGAPGTSVGGELFAGAVYVLRGDTSSPAFEYSATDFGNGAGTAGVVYSGTASGDQAGFAVARAGDMLAGSGDFDDLIISAPFNDGIGKPNSGTLYLVPGAVGTSNPQGYDLGDVELGLPQAPGLAIFGAQSNDGQQGVFGAHAGDWTGDGRTELVVGHANATYVGDDFVAVGAGRIRILDADAAAAAGSSVDLAAPPAGIRVLELAGESNLGFGGGSLASGDFNNDGNIDIAIGAPGAPTDPNPLDPSGVALSRTGRAHIVYGPLFRLGGIEPDRGSQFAGVFNESFAPDYTGLEAQQVEITVNAGSTFTIDDIDLAEIGSDELGWKDVTPISVDFPSLVAELPAFLLGPNDVTVDLRLTLGGVVGFAPDVYTYEASAFRAIDEFAQAGFGADGKPPRLQMAGDFLESGEVLLVQDQWPPEVELAVLVFGPALFADPPTLKGGLFPVQFIPDFVQFFPFPGASGFDFTIDMPPTIDPALEGTSVYLHLVTRELSGTTVKWGFSNVLEATFLLGGV